VSESEAPEDPAAAYDLESYEPEGILVSGKGFQDRYDIYLDVIFNGNEIAEIRVIDHRETKGFGDGALRAVPERIISQQSTEVDVQTGATWTSKSAMMLVQQAVEQAGVTLVEQEAGEVAAPTVKKTARRNVIDLCLRVRRHSQIISWKGKTT
jgi:Na+-translocating ferredoxin:NAD+ oxidoreductase RnfG subunit